MNTLKKYYLIISRKDLFVLEQELKAFKIMYIETSVIKKDYVLFIVEIRQIDLIVALSTLRAKCKFIDPLISMDTYKKMYSNIMLISDYNLTRVRADYSIYESIMANRENINPTHSGYYLLLPVTIDISKIKESLKETAHCNDVMKTLGLFLEDNEIRYGLPDILIESIETIKNKERFHLKGLTIEQIQERNDNFYMNVILEFVSRAKLSYSTNEIIAFLNDKLR